MAVNAYTINRAKHTLFYRVNDKGVPVQLPFYVIDIDGQQAYTEMALTFRAPNATPLQGSAENVVFLDREQPVPLRHPTDKNIVPVYSYYGY